MDERRETDGGMVMFGNKCERVLVTADSLSTSIHGLTIPGNQALFHWLLSPLTPLFLIWEALICFWGQEGGSGTWHALCGLLSYVVLLHSWMRILSSFILFLVFPLFCFGCFGFYLWLAGFHHHFNCVCSAQPLVAWPNDKGNIMEWVPIQFNSIQYNTRKKREALSLHDFPLLIWLHGNSYS
jgi:hypothetical protein